MSRIVALGEASRVAGFELAGVEVISAEDGAAVLDAWERLAPDTGVLLLTPAAAELLAERRRDHPRVLTVVMPS